MLGPLQLRPRPGPERHRRSVRGDDHLTTRAAPRPLTFIGVPVDSVGRQGGTEHSPDALRELGLVDALGGPDGGDLDVRIRGEQRDPDTGIVASDDVLAMTEKIRDAVARSIDEGGRPFLAGGCCSEVPGALAGARDALGRVGLAYLDGHIDLYDGATSPTGEAADMPVSVAVGHGPAAWVDAAGGASLATGDTALVGYRDKAESLEHDMVQPEDLGGWAADLAVEDVRAGGPAAVGERVAATVGGRTPYWVHLDVDVLDRDEFPATDYLLPGGMSWEELAPVLAPIASSERVVGISLGCYNPEKDPGQACGRRLVDEVGAALGR